MLKHDGKIGIEKRVFLAKKWKKKLVTNTGFLLVVNHLKRKP